MQVAEMKGIEFEIVGSTDNAINGINRLISALNGLRNNLNRGYANEGTRQIRNIGNNARSASRNLQKLGSSAKNVGTRFSSASGGIGKFVSSLKRILMYRAIRGLLSSITQAIKTGISNMYEYSRVAGTEFASAMNTAKSAATSWKNSLAAAFAPLIEWLVPYLKIAVQWIMNLNNAIGAFFAALTGKSTYTAAIWYTDEYKESVEGATGAVKELQKYLAPFDELNVLPSNSSSGGGSGGGSPDYSSMFEERELPAWANSVKEFLDTIKGWIEDFWSWLTSLDVVVWIQEQWNNITALFVEAWGAVKDWLAEKVDALQELIPDSLEDIIPTVVTLAVEFALSPILAKETALEFLHGKIGDSITGELPAVVNLVLSFVTSPLVGTADAMVLIKEKLADIKVDIPALITLVLSFALNPLAARNVAMSYINEKLGDLVTEVETAVEFVPEVAVEADGLSVADAILEKIALKKTIEATTQAKLKVVTAVSAVSTEGLTVEDAIKEKLAVKAQSVTIPATVNVKTTVNSTTYEGLSIQDAIDEKLAVKATQTTASVATTSAESTASSFWSTVWNKINDPTLIEKLIVAPLAVSFAGAFPTALSTAFGTGAGVPLLVTPEIPGNSNIAQWMEENGKTGNATIDVTYRNNWTYPNSTIGTDLTKRGMAGNATVSVGYQNSWQYPTNSIGASLQKRGLVGSASLPIGYYSNWTYPNSTIANSMDKRGWIGSSTIGIDYEAAWTYSNYTIAKSMEIRGWVGSVSVPVTYYSTTSPYAMTKAKGGVFSGGKWSPIESFASGGFPRGQMFIAREAGPELVGTLKGHTAVMNNDQIVASVSAGVAKAISSIQFHMTGLGSAANMPTYEEDGDTEEMMYRAFMRAMTNAGLLDSFDINLTAELDGDVVYQNTVRRNRQNTRMTGVNALV